MVSEMLCKALILLSLLALALAAPPQDIPIVSSTNDISPDGSYQWSYQSGDGSSQQQIGELKILGHDAGNVAQGSSSWIDPEGGQHQLSYVADDNGYQPQSADLPVGPPVPPAILRAIEWIASHPQPEQRRIK